jgi:hypothetical protein
MKRTITALAALALVGCNAEPEKLDWATAPNDPQVQEYAFNRCLQSTRGPQETKYNDWDEAIDACSRVASGVSFYCPAGASCQRNVPTLSAVRAILPKEADQ